MSYELINWEDSPSTNTPINAENLKHMEEGIENAHANADKLSIYKANSILQTKSGTTVYASDCAAVPPERITLFGKSTQETVPGNQLFDDVAYFEAQGFTQNGDYWEGSGDYNILFTNEKQISGSLIIEYDIKCTADENPFVLEVLYADSTSEYLGAFANEEWVHNKLTTDSTKTVDCIYRTLVNVGTFLISNIMISVNGGSYEPYVGGEQSPNMKYPQTVEHLGASGSIGEKVLTKNLWDKEYANNVDNWVKRTTEPNKSYKDLLIRVGIGKTITVSYENELNTGLSMYVGVALSNNSEITKWLYHSNADSLINRTVTFTSSEDYIYIRMYADVFDAFMEYIGNDLQIEISDTKTDHEDYTEQACTFLTPDGLKGVPLGTTIPDAIANSEIHMSGVYWDEEEGQYYIADTKNEGGQDVQRITEYVVDGNNVCDLYKSFQGFAISNVLPSVFNRREGFCNQLTVRTQSTGLVIDNGLWLGVNNNTLYAIRNSFYDETLEDNGLTNFKAHLNENPLVITTWIDEPIITDTSSEELAELEALCMNYPNTTIINDAGAYMEVEYVADTQKHIEQNYVAKTEFEELKDTVLEIQQVLVSE